MELSKLLIFQAKIQHKSLIYHVYALALFCCIVISYQFTLGAHAQVASTDTSHTLHVLNRLTYGPCSEDIETINKIGINNYISQQLHPESIKTPEFLVKLVASKPVYTMTPTLLFMNYGRPALQALARQNNNQSLDGDSKKETQQLIRDTYKSLYLDLAEVRLSRALYSPRQLEELLTEFWFNHFNVSFDKGLDHLWIGSYEENAIRPFVLSKFRNLLGATAHHAAMLFYLDNWENSQAENNLANRNAKFKGLNENYARELMELHTLGVDGGYTQKDVTELARILTGLGLPARGRRHTTFNSLNDPFGNYFDPNRHDYGNKIFLGKVIKGQGENEIEQALDILARHPSTAQHISYQLAQFFICDNPPQTLVHKLTKAYLSSDGDIRHVLGVLFASSEFWDKQYQNTKFKSPYRYLLSTLRTTNAQIDSLLKLVGFFKQQGMPLYQCLTPDGYKNTQEAWLNSDALVNRLNFATNFGSGRMPGIQPNIDDFNVVTPLLDNILSPSTRTAVLDAPPKLKPSLILGSPEFMMY